MQVESDSASAVKGLQFVWISALVPYQRHDSIVNHPLQGHELFSTASKVATLYLNTES